MDSIKKNNLFVSVIITTFNRPELLNDAIKSVLKQSYQFFQIIIVDDRGDDVSDIIESFNSDKIVFLSNVKNLGPSYSRNTALKISDGEIITYLDDDDIYCSNHLENIVKVFELNENLYAAYSDSEYVNEIVNKGKRVTISKNNRFIGNEYSYDRLMISNYIPINSFSHRKTILTEVGLFNEKMRLYEDWDFLLRIAQKYKYFHINEITTQVRNRLNENNDLLLAGKHNIFYEYRKIYCKYSDNLTERVKFKRNSKLCHYLRQHLFSSLPLTYKYNISVKIPLQCLRYLLSFVRYKILLKFFKA